MPALDLNFGDVGKVPEEGVYLLETVKGTVKPTKAGDSNNLNIQCKIVDSPDPKFEGFTVWETINLKENSRWKLQQYLEANTGEDWKDDQMQLDTDDLPGLRAYAICFHSEYNKQISLKVQTWLGQDLPDGVTDLPTGNGTSL